MVERNRAALQDRPLDDESGDILGIKPYAKALSKFVIQCDTPMTIAIQGDWGTGKTSLMTLVRNEVHNDAITVEFNTWQYSQFAMADSLAFSFLSRLIEAISPPDMMDKAKSAVKNVLVGAGAALFRVGVGSVLGAVAQGLGASDTGNITPESKSKEQADMAESVSKLKEMLRATCKAAIEEPKNRGKTSKRIVIFIDDLDRVQPKLAVELLEMMKMYMDIEGCVFVLALDYAVVQRGVSEKFGHSENDLGGRSFFDKIIQLPFTMPTAKYLIDIYLKDLLQKVDIHLDGPRAAICATLLQNSVGANPRSVKRLVNVLKILKLVEIEGSKESPSPESDKKSAMDRDTILFGLVCLQSAYEPLFHYLRNDFSSHTLDALCKSETYTKSETDKEEESEVDTSLFKALELIPRSDEKHQMFEAFFTAFRKAIQQDDDDDISTEELRAAGRILEILAITTIQAGSPISTSGKGYRNDRVTRFCHKVKSAVKNLLPAKGIDKPESEPEGKDDSTYAYRWSAAGEKTKNGRAYDWKIRSHLYTGFQLFPEKPTKDYMEGRWKVMTYIGVGMDDIKRNKNKKYEALQEKFRDLASSTDFKGWGLHKNLRNEDQGVFLEHNVTLILNEEYAETAAERIATVVAPVEKAVNEWLAG
jgi:hypothetical protein